MKTPDSLFVAQFIGSPKMNILDGVQTDKALRLSGHNVAIKSNKLNWRGGLLWYSP